MNREPDNLSSYGNSSNILHTFIRLRQNTPQLAAGMNGGANRVEARQGEDGLASAQFRFDTPQLAAGSFILLGG